MNEELKFKLLGEIHLAEIKKNSLLKMQNDYMASFNYGGERYVSGMIIELDEHIDFLNSLLKDE